MFEIVLSDAVSGAQLNITAQGIQLVMPPSMAISDALSHCRHDLYEAILEQLTNLFESPDVIRTFQTGTDFVSIRESQASE